MKKVVLAILLTGVSGFIGFFCGLMITSIIGFFVLNPKPMFPGGPTPSPQIPRFLGLIMVSLPIFSSAIGVFVGWIAISRIKADDHDARYCDFCEYDLQQLESNRCPECGEPVPRWKKRLLAKMIETNA